MEERILEMTGCEASGLPTGYWFKLNGEKRGAITSQNGGNLNVIHVISKGHSGYDTVELHHTYRMKKYAFFDIDPKKEYYLVVKESSRARQMFFQCYGNLITNSMANPAPLERGQLCYDGEYLLDDEEEENSTYSICENRMLHNTGYWFEYKTSPDGILDIEIASDQRYNLELYADDGSPIQCLNPVSTIVENHITLDRYLEEYLEGNKKYLLRVIGGYQGLTFTICRKYSCDDNTNEIAIASTINICPEVVTRINIPSNRPDYTYSLKSEGTMDSIGANHIYLQYPRGFVEDSASLSVHNYCEESFERLIIVKEAHPQLCMLSDCNISTAYISDEVLNIGSVPSQIKVTNVIDGNFTLETMDLYLHAGQEIFLHPGVSIGNKAQLELIIETCQE